MRERLSQRFGWLLFRIYSCSLPLWGAAFPGTKTLLQQNFIVYGGVTNLMKDCPAFFGPVHHARKKTGQPPERLKIKYNAHGFTRAGGSPIFCSDNVVTFRLRATPALESFGVLSVLGSHAFVYPRLFQFRFLRTSK